jgi:hypothetical protein
MGVKPSARASGVNVRRVREFVNQKTTPHAVTVAQPKAGLQALYAGVFFK